MARAIVHYSAPWRPSASRRRSERHSRRCVCRVAVIVCVDNRTLYVDKIEPDDPMSKFLNIPTK